MFAAVCPAIHVICFSSFIAFISKTQIQKNATAVGWAIAFSLLTDFADYPSRRSVYKAIFRFRPLDPRLFVATLTRFSALIRGGRSAGRVRKSLREGDPTGSRGRGFLRRLRVELRRLRFLRGEGRFCGLGRGS